MATIEARKNGAGHVTSYRVEWYDGGTATVLVDG